jgi:hypothetical protein
MTTRLTSSHKNQDSQEVLARWNEKYQTFAAQAKTLQSLKGSASQHRVSKTFQQYRTAYQDLKIDLKVELANRQSQSNQDPILSTGHDWLSGLKQSHHQVKQSIAHLSTLNSKSSLSTQIHNSKDAHEIFKTTFYQLETTKSLSQDLSSYMKGYYSLKMHLATLRHSLPSSDSRCTVVDKIKQNARSLHQHALSFEKKPVVEFPPYTLELRFSGNRSQALTISNTSDIRAFAKTVEEHIQSSNESVRLNFPQRFLSLTQAVKIANDIQKFTTSKTLDFDHSKYQSGTYSQTFTISPKILKTEETKKGEIKRIYANGTHELFVSESGYYCGTRYFPDSRKESGRFNTYDGNLSNGYRVETDGQITFVHPLSLISSYHTAPPLHIVEVEGKLVVLEQPHSKHMISETSLIEALIKLGSGEKSIKPVLEHKAFKKHKAAFIQHMLGTEPSGTPRLFNFSNVVISNVLDILNIRSINPLTMTDPTTGQNLFQHIANRTIAYNEDPPLIIKLAKSFPEAFQLIGVEIIETALRKEMEWENILLLAKQFTEVGGQFDLYHQIWLQTAQGAVPDASFNQALTSFTPDQRRVIYKTAFDYNNPHIHEPSDIAIQPQQYSVNLMFINQGRIPSSQNFLFGKGSSQAERKQYFRDHFIKPVSKWAKASPDTTVNVWVDGEMATKTAIRKTKSDLSKKLIGKTHGPVKFRDIRTLDTVRSHPEVFSEKMPVYFRVDLLRAIIADSILRIKETQFFVYGDLDMKALSLQELFDQKTVQLLNRWGFVMAKKAGVLKYENGFQIINGEHEALMDSHRKTIIDMNLQRAIQKPQEVDQQQVYDIYKMMMAHLLEKEGSRGVLEFSDEKELDGLDTAKKMQWIMVNWGPKYLFYLNFKRRKDGVEVNAADVGKNSIPTKPVVLPPSRFFGGSGAAVSYS